MHKLIRQVRNSTIAPRTRRCRNRLCTLNSLAILTVSVTIASGCVSESPNGSSVATVSSDSAGVTIVSAESLAGLPARTLGPPLIDLAASQDSADRSFSWVSAVRRLADGRIVIADGGGRRLKVYGPDATYRQTVTGSDGTPAEVSAITAIWPAGGNQIAVFDQRKQRVTTLSLDGGTLQSTDLVTPGLRARPVGRLDTGEVLVRNLIVDVPETGFELAHVSVVRFGTDGVMVDTVGVWPTARMGRLGDPPMQLVSGPMFEPRLVTAAAGNRLVVSDCRSAEYSVIDPELGLVQVVRWPAGDLDVTEDDIRLYRTRRLAGLDAGRQSRVLRILDDMTVNPAVPACDRLKIDTNGRVWIRSFVRPAAVQQQWLVFDPAGRPLFSVELPVATRIMDPGASHITVIETDTLRVQRVRVYGFE